MWHYFWAHSVYHLTRLCPKQRTRKCPLVALLVLLSVLTAGPQLYLIYIRDYYVMSCPFPIHTLMVCSALFSFFMIGFCVVFAVCEPVPDGVKTAFHLYGAADALFELVFITYAYKSIACTVVATEMFVIYMIIAVGSLITFLYFLVLVPLWVCNKSVFRNALYDQREKGAACNGCIATCPCIWHV